jgi:hypothetical protein
MKQTRSGEKHLAGGVMTYRIRQIISGRQQKYFYNSRCPIGLHHFYHLGKMRGIMMNTDLNQLNSLRKIEEDVAKELDIRADALDRMLAKVEEYSESHKARGLQDDLLNILKDDLSIKEQAEAFHAGR